jgi:hypothetical protein
MKSIMIEDSRLNLNKFIDGIKLKKQYIEKLKNKISDLNYLRPIIKIWSQ